MLEKGYIGSGAAGRNTAILRSNYRTPEGARFYEQSLRLYERLSTELDFNLLFAKQGHLTLAHSDRAEFVMEERAEVNRLLGIDSRVIGRDEIKRLVPAMNVTEEAAYPIQAALYHPPGGTIRRRGGVGPRERRRPRWRRDPPVHGGDRDRALERSRDRRAHHAGGRQGRDRRQLRRRMEHPDLRPRRRAPAGDHAHPPGLRHRAAEAVPRRRRGLLPDAPVREPDGSRRDADRGRDRAVDDVSPAGHAQLPQEGSRHALELFPQLERVRMLQSWAGLCDLSPDYSPILGETSVDGFLISTGWGTYGFKAAPIVGSTLAELVDSGRTPELIEPFRLGQFYEDRLVSELAAAAVSHLAEGATTSRRRTRSGARRGNEE